MEKSFDGASPATRAGHAERLCLEAILVLKDTQAIYGAENMNKALGKLVESLLEMRKVISEEIDAEEPCPKLHE